MNGFVAWFLVLVLASPLLLSKEKEHPWETGKVLSQNLDSQRAGAYAAPMGTGTIAVPIYRRSNTVVIETSMYVYTWGEVGRKPVIMIVNGTVDFYRDGNFFVVLDSNHKKHKFALLGMRAK